jgi:hypothetical protein
MKSTLKLPRDKMRRLAHQIARLAIQIADYFTLLPLKCAYSRSHRIAARTASRSKGATFQLAKGQSQSASRLG